MGAKATRILEEPIIFSGMDERMGANINGPSLICVPSWVRNPLGKYYLYFAHHRGTYIRMAYSNKLSGPWKMYTPGVLDLSNSFFEIMDITEYSEKLKGTDLYAHIASPDVHIDDENQRIFMYYHGMLSDADQKTRIAYSNDGLMFNAEPTLLGPAYFRAIKFQDWIYVVTWAGYLLRSRLWEGPFEQGAMLKGIISADNPDRILRHSALLLRENVLHIFYSCIGDIPERILHAKVNVAKDWESWGIEAETMVLKPELKWEGTKLPIKRSVVGAADLPQHELRDPCFFEENGKLYLLYCGAGESGGIGIAKMELNFEI